MSELIAYLAGRRAGRLIRKDNGNLHFRYDDGYDGPPLSQSLPVRAEAHPHAACRAVFGGLLPEGDGREALARARRVPRQLASDVGVSERFARRVTTAVLERAQVAIREYRVEHDDPTGMAIALRVRAIRL